MNHHSIFALKDKPQSLWIATTEKPNYPRLEEDIKTEILIIGGGIAGITCGYLLQKEGFSVTILEGDKIANGTTGHTTAKITSQHGLLYSKLKKQMSEELARQYAQANETAIHEIKNVVDALQIDCDYLPQSAYVYTQREDILEKIQEEADAALSLGIDAAYCDTVPIPLSVKGAVAFHHQAQFHPLKYVLRLAEAFVEKGGRLFENSRAVSLDEIQEKDSHYLVQTDKNCKVMAKEVIIASHYPFYNKQGMYFSRIYPERSYVVALKTKEKYSGGLYICEEEPTRSLRSQKYGDSELVLFGGENHKTGQGADTRNHYQTLMEAGSQLFTIEDIPFHWSTQDCMTLDSLPYVGNLTSKTPHLYILTGFNKWGMTNSMASAMLLRDLLLKGESPWQEVYSPSRGATLSSAVEFVVENADVGKNLIKGKLESNPPQESVQLKADEGRVVEVGGERLGIYKDPEGGLHTVNTTCTHMGCELNWNAAERSWDCPCHGSRFSVDGAIIEGPATRPLSISYDVNTLKKLLTEDF